MNLVLTVVNITAPVFLLAGIGFGWVRLGFDYPVAFVTRLAMTFAVPALIFVALMQSAITPTALATLTLAALSAYALIALASLVLIKVVGLAPPTYWAPMIFGNTGNLGLPLALFAFGDLGLEYAVVVFAVSAILVFTVGIWMVSGSGALGKAIKEPTVWATLLGALFLWQGWQTPLVVTNALGLIGQMAIPLMLITLGVAVAQLRAQAIVQAILLSFAKIAVCLICGWVASRLFALDPVAAAVLVVQLVTPVAVTSYLLAQKYGANAGSVAGLVVTSTFLSVITLPLILAFVI